ncbi:MAG: hypothetical protein ACYC69_16530 [Thermodesulfovibrionales bacterium]
MNEKNTNKLIKDFPILYRGHTKSPQESLMCFGFCHGDGWYNLIYTLSCALANYMNENPGLQLEVAQVKEKFGTLRYHTEGGDDYTEKLINEACCKSSTICEECGEPAETKRHSGWFATLCRVCAFAKGYDEPLQPEEEEDMTADAEKPSPFGEQVKCVKCGWIHFVNISKEYASHGYRCFRCGIEGKANFVAPTSEELPLGSTIQQVNTVKPK